jgi:hypothetical protein
MTEHKIPSVRYRTSRIDSPDYDYVAVDTTAVPTVGSLYRLADEFQLPRPIWPLAIVDEALRRAGL